MKKNQMDGFSDGVLAVNIAMIPCRLGTLAEITKGNVGRVVRPGSPLGFLGE